MKPHLMLLVLAALIVDACSPAGGEWTYVNLHPTGLQNSSWLVGVDDGQQVGSVEPNGPVGLATAAMWSGRAGSYVSLNPPDSYSDAYAVSQASKLAGFFSTGLGTPSSGAVPPTPT